MLNLNDERYLTPEYFSGDVVVHARDLIGRELVVRNVSDGSVLCGVIVETEAYGGGDDPASHAAFRAGGRAAVVFGPPGVIYVYAAYGMYPCLNVVTGEAGLPAAVLIRAITLSDGSSSVSGPGRVSRYLGVTLDDHGHMVGDGRIDISMARRAVDVQHGPRVGITRGVDVPWRFVGTLLNARDSWSSID